MKTEIQKIEDWLSGLPEGEISQGQFAKVDGDKISVMSIWNGTHTETMDLETFKYMMNPYGGPYCWE